MLERERSRTKPIYLLFVSDGAQICPMMSHPRNLIVAEESSQATVVEDYVSLGSGSALCNTVTELIAGDNTVVSHYMIEREDTRAFNVSTLRIQQGRNANVASHSVLLGGAIVRNNVHPVLAGEGGECLINGLFVGNGSQHLDNYMLVEHASRTLREPPVLQWHSRRAARTACSTAASSCTRTRKRPTRSRPTATCCSPTTRKSTRSRSWRSTLTT